MNEGVGALLTDMSGNGHYGDITGAAWTNGKLGKGLSFDGTDDGVNLSSAGQNWSTYFSSSLDFTISAWIKPTTVGYFALVSQRYGDAMVFGMGDGVVFPAGRLFLNMDDTRASSPYSTGSVTAGVWQHVAVSFKGSDASCAVVFYINGQSAGTGTSCDGNGIDPQDLLFLGYQTRTGIGGPDSYYSGLMDDVRLYNRVLSATDISNLYRAGQITRKTVSNQGLVGYWPFNEGVGTTAGDASGSGNTGTFAGGAPPTWTTAKRGKGINYAGGDAYLTHSTTGISSTNGTVAGWVYPTAAQWGFWQTHDSSSQNWVDWISLFNYWGGTFYFRMGNGSDCCSNDLTFTTSSYIPQNQWSFIVFTWSGTSDAAANDTMAVYVNGALVTSRSNANFQATVDSAARIGYGHGIPFTGKYDDLRIYSRALSATEILNLYKQNETKINSSQNTRLTDGLVGLWSFNGADISGATAYDRSTSALNATISGGRLIIGKVGQGFDFFTVSDQVYTSSTSILDTDVHSISFWIKFNADSTYWGQIFAFRPAGTDRSPGIWTYSGANCIHWRYDPGNSGPTSCGGPTGENTYFSLQTWYHVVGVKDGGTFKFYVNGAEAGSGGVANPKTSGASTINMGQTGYSSGIFSLDEVRIYNRALSAAEAKQLYNMGK